jgi:hypothetical protein
MSRLGGNFLALSLRLRLDSDPIRICFNPEEGCSRDVSGDVARELHHRCDLAGREVPAGLVDFIKRHEGPSRQLTLRLIR